MLRFHLNAPVADARSVSPSLHLQIRNTRWEISLKTWAGVRRRTYFRFNKNENEETWLERLRLQAVFESCTVWSTELWTRRLTLTRSNGLMGIVPEWQRWDFTPSPLRHARCEIWCTRAARLKEQNKHECHARRLEASEEICKVVLKKRGEAVTQISERRKISLCFYEFIKQQAACSRVCRNKLICMERNEVISIPLCVFLSFHPSGLPSLAPAVSVYYQETRRACSTAPPVIPSSSSPPQKMLQFAPFCCTPPLCLSVSVL